MPPQSIASYYNGGLRYPRWSQPAVEDLFLNRSSKGSGTSTSSQHKVVTPRIRDIIGGAVRGVVAILAIIICAALFLIRRKRAKERERAATRRMPSMHETEERHAAGGLYEAEGPGLPADASDGERRIPEVDTGQPIPHEVDSTALASTLELQSPTHRQDTHPTGDLFPPKQQVLRPSLITISYTT